MQELLAMVDLEYLLGRYGPQEEVNWGEVSHREPGLEYRGWKKVSYRWCELPL
jgi:hypothetical protein